MTTMQNGGTGSCTKHFAEKLKLIERPELGSWLRLDRAASAIGSDWKRSCREVTNPSEKEIPAPTESVT